MLRYRIWFVSDEYVLHYAYPKESKLILGGYFNTKEEAKKEVKRIVESLKKIKIAEEGYVEV